MHFNSIKTLMLPIFAGLVLVSAGRRKIRISSIPALLNGPQPTTYPIPPQSYDPSFLMPQDAYSSYSYGDGIKVPRIGANDAYTTGSGNQHCWTEQWWVDTQIVYGYWYMYGSAIDCATTSQCSNYVLNINQTCTTHTTTWDNALELGITQKWEADLKLAILGAKYGVDTNQGFSHSSGGSTGDQVCMSQTEELSCSWNDQLCHQVWTAPRQVMIWGYIARVCSGPAKAGITQQNTKTSTGSYLRGIANYNFTMPANSIVGCGGYCGNQSYPDPLPADGTQIIPYPGSSN